MKATLAARSRRSGSRSVALVVLAAGAALLALLVNPAVPVIPARGASPTALAFATPTVVDPVNLYGEPDLRVDKSMPNVWYASGPWGTGTQKSIWNQSQDGTHTFRELHDRPDPLHTGGSLAPPGGGDTEIAVDHNGKFYGADLGALVTQHTITSTDRGKSFQSQPVPPAFQDTSGAGTDRQWFGLWDPPSGTAVQSAYHGPWPVNYMTYLEALPGGNGETITSSVPTGTDSSRVGLDYACAPGAMGTSMCPTWQLAGDGYTVIDQVTGKVLQGIDYASGAADQAAVEILTPGADGYMIASGPGAPQRKTVYTLNAASTGAIFPVMAMDAARNAYYIWVERPNDETVPRTSRSWQVFYSWSPPGPNSDWSQWSPPIQVSTPPSTTAIMPWAVAGGNGNLDIAWYGTASNPLNPESDNDPQTASASWYVYMAQVLHATDPATRTITQVRAVDHPMHHGSICLIGASCIFIHGNRNLADFFEITTDATGAAYIVYDNTANDLIDQAPITETGAPAGVLDHQGAELVHVVRQVGGPSLNDGQYINQATDVGVNTMTSGTGDALYDPVSGVNYPGLDITGASVQLQDTNLVAQIKVSDLTKVQAAATGIGAPFIDFVLRWEFKSRLYFAAVEMPAGQDAGLFFDGASQTVDLCSVSACDPHIMTYPGPTVAPTTSHSISGQVSPQTGTIELQVPVGDVGSPQKGDHLDSVGAYSFVQNTSAYVPLSNAEAQDDLVPVEVDGACCFTPALGVQAASTGSGTTGGGGNPTASDINTLPNTSTDGGLRALLAASLVAVLGAGGVVLAERRRRLRP